MSKEAMKLALEAAYLAEWNASGEGYNSEYPFGDHARNPEEDAAWIKDRDNALREALAEQPAPSQYGSPELQAMIVARAMEKNAAEQPAQQEPVADRENAIIRFALHQFMSNAYSNMNAAAQDKDSRHYTVSAVEKFAKDAKDAEALLSRLQFKTPQPAQRKPWVGLTDVEIASACKKHGGAEWWWRDIEEYGRAIEAKLRERNT